MSWLKKFDLKTILIMALCVVLLLRSCGGEEGEKEIVNVDGKDYELLEQKVDTVVVEKTVYFAKYEVKDTLNLTYDFPKGVTDSLGQKPNPTLGYGILTDIISQNQIQSRDVDWFFQIPTVYNTTIVKELPKNEFYWGLNGGFNKEDVISNVGAGLILKSKNNNLYQLGLGIQNNSNTSQLAPFITGGMYWKIGKK